MFTKLNYSDLPDFVTKMCDGPAFLTARLTQILQDFFREDFHYQAYARKRPNSVYADDGNTQVSGTAYTVLYIIPLWRQPLEEWSEWNNWYERSGLSSVSVSVESTFRDSDQRLFHCFWELKVAHAICDETRKTNGTRVDYGHLSSACSQLKPSESSLARFLQLVEEVGNEAVLTHKAKAFHASYFPSP